MYKYNYIFYHFYCYIVIHIPLLYQTKILIILVASTRQRGVTVALRLLAAIGAKMVGPRDLQVGKYRAFGAH